MSTTENLTLDRETIAKVDPTDQLGDVLALPDHLRDALWKAESAGLGQWESPAGLIVDRVRQPYNLGSLSQRAAELALGELSPSITRAVELVVAERARMARALAELLPS